MTLFPLPSDVGMLAGSASPQAFRLLAFGSMQYAEVSVVELHRLGILALLTASSRLGGPFVYLPLEGDFSVFVSRYRAEHGYHPAFALVEFDDDPCAALSEFAADAARRWLPIQLKEQP